MTTFVQFMSRVGEHGEYRFDYVGDIVPMPQVPTIGEVITYHGVWRVVDIEWRLPHHGSFNWPRPKSRPDRLDATVLVETADGIFVGEGTP